MHGGHRRVEAPPPGRLRHRPRPAANPSRWHDSMGLVDVGPRTRPTPGACGMTAPDPRLVNIKAVWFDVGEVLIDESREYGTWADWLGVPRHTFSAVFGAVIASGRDYREVFQHFR